MGGLLNPSPSMPDIKMPPPPPPPAPMDKPEMAEAELEMATGDNPVKENTGSKRKYRVKNKRKIFSTKYCLNNFYIISL